VVSKDVLDNEAKLNRDVRNDIVYLSEYTVEFAKEWARTLITHVDVNETAEDRIHAFLRKYLLRVDRLEANRLRNIMFNLRNNPEPDVSVFFERGTIDHFLGLWAQSSKPSMEFKVESLALISVAELAVDRWYDSMVYTTDFDTDLMMPAYNRNIDAAQVQKYRAESVEMKVLVRLLALIEIPPAYFRALQTLKPNSKYLKLLQSHVASLAPAEAD
jgi:hypothetical protein